MNPYSSKQQPPNPTFTTRKSRILASLARPAGQYTDASPKGAVDEGIRELLEVVNAHVGLVSTSSCAGRVSVFLEGDRGGVAGDGGDDARGGGEGDGVSGEGEGGAEGGGEGNSSAKKEANAGLRVSGVTSRRRKRGVGGRWLFVSHEPVALPEPTAAGEQTTCTKMLGLEPYDAQLVPASATESGKTHRLVHFKFEPMILHVLTSSLAHANHILTAAQQAGFRESGASSLDSECPVVAVRCQGLALDCVVGFSARLVRGFGGSSPREEEGQQDENTATGDRTGDPRFKEEEEEEEAKAIATVSEAHLRMLLEEANSRFVANQERMRRFQELLMKPPKGDVSNGRANGEDRESRKERKRAAGLARQRRLREQRDEVGSTWSDVADE